MPRAGSLRARLLVWYTGLLAVVIVAFGAIVGYVAWRAKLADIDEVLRRRASVLAAGLQPAGAGTFDLVLPRDTGADVPYHAVWNAAGKVVDLSDETLDAAPPAGHGVRTRDGRRELTVRASDAYVLVGLPLDEARAETTELASTIAAVGILALVVSALGGRYLVDRALRPLRNIDHTARAMVEGDFVARVRIDRADTELGQLARALNEAFDRLHAALERQRRFTADASHELRTPLSTMSTEIQWALGQSRASEAYRGSLEVCLRASARMQTIVERLLALARGDADADVVACAPVSLDEVVGAVVRDLTPLAKARSLELAVRVSPVCCMGDRDRLVEAVTNVVENAIRYNREGGRVSVAVHQQAGHVEIVVADTGVGIDRDDLPRVFEPFFRSDPARTRGGSGLGLSLTRATVRRHGGDVRCDSERGRGTTITISLPAHASASHRS